MMAMGRKRLQLWLGIGSVAFVLVYAGAIVITIRSQIDSPRRAAVIESARVDESEKHLLLPELLLPMAILLALATSYLVVRRRNARNYDRLDDDVGGEAELHQGATRNELDS